MKATQRTLHRKTQQTLAECQRALAAGEVYTCAAAFGILHEAEETGVIARQWRSEIAVPAVEALIQAHPETLRAAWHAQRQETDERLQRGVAEMEWLIVPVLTWRSYLQTTRRLLDDPVPSLADVDEGLQRALASAYDAQAFARARGPKQALGLESALAAHWWWYRNTPPASYSE